ncbi:hypothetical protein DFH09DRAFT_1448621 [Mycena vulgaris]|nr:hypothetical protein DFH09DRAFT_1448621 [Mycena vulgaris]
MDKTTEFWNLYKPLADEHDKEFLEKYSTDLDTCLIFAGLFSAVSSAFIIQIQPELQPDPNATDQALMRLLIHTVNSSIFSGPDIIVPVSPAPSAPVVVAQSLLYTSLSCTLLAALLAVLGKQWLMYYSTASERGTIEARGHVPTPLTDLLTPLCGSSLSVPLDDSSSPRNYRHFFELLRCGTVYIHAHISHFGPRLSLSNPAGFISYADGPSFNQALASAIAWVLETSTDPGIIAQMAEKATEIQWPRDTELSGPLTRLRESFLSCFDSTVGRSGMANIGKVREGMADRATQYGRAYCTIRILEGRPDLMLDPNRDTAAAVKWALHVIPSLHLNRLQLEVFIDNFRPGQILRLTPASFADYLFCVNSFLTGNRENMGWTDKTFSQICQESPNIVHLRPPPESHLGTDGNTIDNIFAGEILRLTAQLADTVENNEKYTNSTTERMKQVYRFCSVIPRSAGWLEAASSAVMLARGDSGIRGRWLSAHPFGFDEFQPEANHAEWVHAALNHVEQLRVNPDDWDYRTSALDGLLQALWADPRAVTVPPPKATLRVILWALNTPGNLAVNALDLLCNAPAGFQDAELQVMMQQCSVWQLLGRVASRESVGWWLCSGYFELGEVLSNTAQWEPIVRDDLAGWITVFLQYEGAATYIFNTVLVRVWLKPGDNEVNQTRGLQKSITVMFQALTKAWDELNLIQPRELSNFCRLAKCTALAALRTHYYNYVFKEAILIPPDFRVTFSVRLRDSLIHAAEKARAEINPSQPLDERDEMLTVAAKILEQIGTHVPCNDSGADVTDLELAAIKDQINVSINTLEGRFSETSLVK